MDLPKTAEVPSNICGDQNQLTGLLVAGGRIHYEQYGEKEDQKGFVFKKNHGFQMAIDPTHAKELGVTMEVLMDCVKQLEEMGDAKTIKDKIGFRDQQGYLPNGLVIVSKLDPRLKMSVMYNSSDYEDTDFLLNWFLDNEHLDSEAKRTSPTYRPERTVDADELQSVEKAREAAALSAPLPVKKESLSYEEQMLGLTESTPIQEHVNLFRSDKPEYLSEGVLKEDWVYISLKPGINVVKLAEKIEDALEVDVEVLKNGINIFTDDRDDVKEAVKIIGKEKIKALPQFQDMLEDADVVLQTQVNGHMVKFMSDGSAYVWLHNGKKVIAKDKEEVLKITKDDAPKEDWEGSGPDSEQSTMSGSTLIPMMAGKQEEAVGEQEKRELELYLDNDSKLYPQKLAILKNVARKIKNGSYNPELAPKLWMYWVDAGAKKYNQDHGDPKDNIGAIFNKETRMALAKEIAEYEHERIMNGEYSSFLGNLDPSKKENVGESVINETGEADQDYDKEFYDVIANALKKKGYDVKHREFDKYQGIYFDISKGGKKIGRFFNIEYFVVGKVKKDPNLKYRAADLVGPEGDKYSATAGDYFQMGPNDRFKNTDLLLVYLDGTSKTIHNPRKKDLPQDNEVQRHLEYEGEPDHVAVFANEADENDPPNGAEVRVSADYKKVDVSEFVELIKEAQMAPVESKTVKGNPLMENKRPNVQKGVSFSHAEAGSFESVDFWGIPLTEDDYTHVGQGLAKPTGKEGTEYGEKQAGKPEYEKNIAQYDSEVKKLQGNQSSAKTDDNTGKHVEAGSTLEKPKTTAGTEYGEGPGAKKLKVGEITKNDGKGDHVDGTGASTDGMQFSKVDGSKVKVGKPGEDHGDHVEEARGSAKKKVEMLMKKKKMEAKKKSMKKEDMDGTYEEDEESPHYDTNLKMKSAKPMMGRMGELKDKMEKRHPMNKENVNPKTLRSTEAVGSPVGGDKTAKIATVKGSQHVEGKKYQWKPKSEWK